MSPSRLRRSRHHRVAPPPKWQERTALERALQGRLLGVIHRRWRVRVATCPYVFHHSGKRIVRFDAAWDAACETVGLPGPLFHDLRRSGARNLLRAGKAESVIERLGGWKTRAVFARYDITDEQDLADAGDAYDAFLDRKIGGERKVRVLRASR